MVAGDQNGTPSSSNVFELLLTSISYFVRTRPKCALKGRRLLIWNPLGPLRLAGDVIDASSSSLHRKLFDLLARAVGHFQVVSGRRRASGGTVCFNIGIKGNSPATCHFSINSCSKPKRKPQVQVDFGRFFAQSYIVRRWCR